MDVVIYIIGAFVTAIGLYVWMHLSDGAKADEGMIALMSTVSGIFWVLILPVAVVGAMLFGFSFSIKIVGNYVLKRFYIRRKK